MSDDKMRESAFEYIKALKESNVVRVRVEDEMRRSFISYAMAVNVSRAIPDVRDGLKPVHRRILYAMSELSLEYDKPYRKCARIVGDVMGKYHPHGDSAIYDALVRLAQGFSMSVPLVDGQGNFGSVDGDPPAAQRYTEARLTKISSEMLRDIEKETVDFYPNFDETLKQPRVLPSRFPNLLVNGADGIAVGMATNIPPHNLGEVIDAVTAIIDDPEISIDDLIRILPCPDYPTGGVLSGRGAVRQAYRTGKGGVVIRAKCDIEEYANNTKMRIVVTELPYQVNKAQLVKNIDTMIKEKRLEGISEIRDESDRTGMRVVAELKRDANAQVALNMLYKHTQLQVKTGITLLALADGEPKILNLKEILSYYLEHQRSVVVRRARFDLERAEERRHIVEGLCVALSCIDEVIATIKQSQDKNDAAQKLIERFSFTDRQANAILEMRLQRLTNLEITALRAELEELSKTIIDLTDILNRPERVNSIIKTEISEIREKFAVPRRTEIAPFDEEIDISDLIEREDVIISMTHFGYIKRMGTKEYRVQRKGGVGVTAHKPKEEDFVEQMFTTNTHDDLLFFTNRGKVYQIKGYDVPDAEKTARGRAIVNLLALGEGERVTTVIPFKEGDEKSGGNLFMATKGGLVKKSRLEEFQSIRSTGKIAITLQEADELINVSKTSGDDEILMASKFGQCIRFNEKHVRVTGRGSQGVRSMKLASGDCVVDSTVLCDGFEIITVSENGYGKRTDPADYRPQARSGKGLKAGVFNDKTGSLVNLKLVHPDDDLILIADNGAIIRVRAAEISKIGRATQGVRIMKFRGEGIKVVSVSTTPPEKDDETVDGEVPDATAVTVATAETPEAMPENSAEPNGDGVAE